MPTAALTRVNDKLTEAQAGAEHLGHQVIFLQWALHMELVFGGGICGDAVGLGKTHEFISLIIAGNLYLQRRREESDPPIRPTLVVCPHSLGAQTYYGLKRQLEADFNVHQIKKGTSSFDASHPWYRGTRRQYNVMVATYNQLSLLPADPGYDGLFERVIPDEALAIRRFNDVTWHHSLNVYPTFTLVLHRHACG